MVTQHAKDCAQAVNPNCKPDKDRAQVVHHGAQLVCSHQDCELRTGTTERSWLVGGA